MPALSSDDPWRLRDALTGDEAAWAAIFLAFNQQIWHWARGCGLTREDAKDVAQTVWCRLKDRGHTIDRPAGLPQWLATTTKREGWATKGRRDRSQAPEYFDSPEIAETPFLTFDDTNPEEMAMLDDIHRRLVAAYAELAPRCRELLPLCWSGLSHADIAEILEWPQGSVSPTRRRCLDNLRAKADIDG